MPVIVPTLTTDDAAKFSELITKFKTFSKRVQIDQSDGTFAPTQLLPLTEMQIPAGMEVDLHLMTAKPTAYLDQILALRPALVIVHAEVTENLDPLFEQLRNNNIKIGIALLKGTLPSKVKERIVAADHVMIFAGKLGEQGGAIDLLQYEKAPLIRAIKPNVEIGWDGGINLSNIRAIAHAGIDVINVGSAISGATDPAAMYQSLLAESDKKGVLLQ